MKQDIQKIFSTLTQVLGVYIIIVSFAPIITKAIYFLLNCTLSTAYSSCSLLGLEIGTQLYSFSQASIQYSTSLFILGTTIFLMGFVWFKKLGKKNEWLLPRWCYGLQIIIGATIFVSVLGTIAVNSHLAPNFVTWSRHATAYLLFSDVKLALSFWLLYRGYKGLKGTTLAEAKKDADIYILATCLMVALVFWVSATPASQTQPIKEQQWFEETEDLYSFGSSDYIKDAVPMESIPVDQYVALATERLEKWKQRGVNPWPEENDDEEFLEEMKTQTDVVDRSSFQIFTLESGTTYTGFAKDKNHFYYNSQIIDGVIPDKFKLVKTGSYNESSRSVYSNLFFFVSEDEIYFYGAAWGKARVAKRIESADVESFHLIGSDWDERSDFYAIDKSHIYFNAKPIESLDPDKISLIFSTSSNSFAKKTIEFVVDQNTGDKYLRGVNISEQLRHMSQEGELIDKDKLNFLAVEKIISATSTDGSLVVKRYDHEGSDYGNRLGIFDANTNTFLREAQIKPMLGGYGVLGFSPDQTQVYFFEGCYEGWCGSPLYRLDIDTGTVQSISGFLGLSPYSVRKSVMSSDHTKIALTDYNPDYPSSYCLSEGGYVDTVVRVLDLATGYVKTVFETSDPIGIVDLELSLDGTRLNIIHDINPLTEVTNEFEPKTYLNTSRDHCAVTSMSSHNGGKYYVRSIDNPF